MTKRILSFGGAVILIGSVALSYLTAGAAPGDIVYVGTQVDTGLLTGTQKTKLVNTVKGFWPSIVIASIDRLRCTGSLKPSAIDAAKLKLVHRCMAYEEYTPTDDQWAAQFLGEASQPDITTKQGAQARALVEVEVDVEAGNVDVIDQFTQAAFGKPVQTIWAFECWRSNPTDRSKVDCARADILVGDPATVRAAKQAGQVSLGLGRVNAVVVP